jgi:hypothetical protein
VTLKQKIADGPASILPLSNAFVMALVGFVIGLAALLILLNLWFRRGDQEVRSRIAQIQGEKAMEALEAGADSGFAPPAKENGFANGDRPPRDPDSEKRSPG